MMTLLLFTALSAPANADMDAKAALALAFLPPKPAPQPIPQGKTCYCSGNCNCGCNEGRPCSCDVVYYPPDTKNLVAVEPNRPTYKTTYPTLKEMAPIIRRELPPAQPVYYTPTPVYNVHHRLEGYLRPITYSMPTRSVSYRSGGC